MIGYLKGTVIDIEDGSVILDVGGIGYMVEMPSSMLSRLPGPGSALKVYTRLIIRDDQLNLYGFLKKRELKVFSTLIEVSGVGPKLALNVLSVIPPDELLSDIAAGNSTRLRSVHGVGKKTAARICVDLKEKASKILAMSGGLKKTGKDDISTGSSVPFMDDAVSALVNLGYRPNEAKRAASEILAKKGANGLDDLIKKSLQLLSRVR